MSDCIISPNRRSGKFQTVAEILTALEVFYRCDFTTHYQYVGGHGDILIARPVAPHPLAVQTHMLVSANGRGWMIGQWGRRDFGKPDVAATTELIDFTRCADCGATACTEIEEIGLVCYDCLSRYTALDIEPLLWEQEVKWEMRSEPWA